MSPVLVSFGGLWTVNDKGYHDGDDGDDVDDDDDDDTWSQQCTYKGQEYSVGEKWKDDGGVEDDDDDDDVCLISQQCVPRKA